MRGKMWYRLARLLPYKLRYYVVINAATDATTGEWSDVEAPGVSIADILKRMK